MLYNFPSMSSTVPSYRLWDLTTCPWSLKDHKYTSTSTRTISNQTQRCSHRRWSGLHKSLQIYQILYRVNLLIQCSQELIRIVLTLSRQLSLEQRALLTLMAALNLIFSVTTITLMTLPRWTYRLQAMELSGLTLIYTPVEKFVLVF